jgi:hypothetical protein
MKLGINGLCAKVYVCLSAQLDQIWRVVYRREKSYLVKFVRKTVTQSYHMS